MGTLLSYNLNLARIQCFRYQLEKFSINYPLPLSKTNLVQEISCTETFEIFMPCTLVIF
jgi:hypothetical protein